MQRKINNTVICLRMGKNLTAKTPPGDFQVTTPKTPLLSQQAVTSKGSQVPYQPTVEPLPQYPMDLFYSDSSPFWCTVPKYVTNSYANLSTRLQNTNWEDCQLQSSSVHPHDEDQEDAWSQNPMVQIYNNFFKRKRWTRLRTLSPVTICLNRVCSMLVQLVYRFTAFKIIRLYV